MSQPASPTGWLRRNALGLWFLGIALVGYARFHGKAFAHGPFEPTLVAWLWLAGAIVLTICGIASLRATRNRGRRS